MNGYLDAYYRVSSKTQKDEGYSLESQQSIAKQVAKRLKLKLREHNEFAKSSTIKGVKRDRFDEIKTLIEKEEIKNLWVVEQERLFRKPSDAFLFQEYYLDEYGVNLYIGEGAEKSVFGSDSDNEIFQFRAMIAGMESKKIRRRSIRGKRHLLDNYSTNKPVFLGGTPTFGYMNVNKEWVINPDESKWVKWMFDSYAKGMSTIEIQSELNINGVSPRRARSGLWGLATIQKMLGNESYTGLKKWFDKEIEKEWVYQIPQIISVSLFQKVQSKLEENLKNKDNNKKNHFLLDGILYCDCGLRFGNESKQRPHGKTETYYCVSRGRKWRGEQVNDCNNHKGLSRTKTDDSILRIVKSVAKDSVRLKEMFKTDILDKKKESDKSLQNDIKRLETKVKRLQKKIEVTVDNIAKVEVAILQGTKDEKVGKQTIKLLEQERSFIETEYKKTFLDIEDLSSQREWLDWVGKYGESLDYNTRSEEKKREFVHGLVKKINVKPVYDKNRDGVQQQLGHIFEVTFKMGIVGDKLIWKDETDKTKGYDLKDGRTTQKSGVIDVTVSRGQPKKKELNQNGKSKDCSELLSNRGMILNGDYFTENWQQYLCFSVEFSSFNLTHRRNRQNWTDAQQETHDLIKLLHDGGMGYRKIAQYLNEQDIKTARGNTWKNTQVFSVLKRYRQRQNRKEVRETPSNIEFGKMELVWERVSG